MVIIHFKEFFLEAVAIKYIGASSKGKLTQYRSDTWLKTKSFKESIDKG